MTPGDLIKHKRSNTLGVIIKTAKGKKGRLATVLFSSGMPLCTAPLKLLEENWEILNDKQE